MQFSQIENSGFNIKSLNKVFEKPSSTDNRVTALRNVSLELEPGKIYGIIGTSGSGKTTLMRLLLGIDVPTSGTITFDGIDINSVNNTKLRSFFRPRVRSVFQHPDASLNPAFTIKKILKQPLDMYGASESNKSADDTIVHNLENVGLTSEYLNKYPHQLSGGEKKRVSICRALITQPQFLFADEPFAGLDATLQLKIRDLFKFIHENYSATLIIISHDLHIIKSLAHNIIVMNESEIMENAAYQPYEGWKFKHPVSQKLNSAINNKHVN